MVENDKIPLEDGKVAKTLKVILKYRKHPSSISISQFPHQTKIFHFSSIDKSTVMKEINNLKPKKVSRDRDIRVKSIKVNSEFFWEYICSQFNIAISSSKFPASFKFADITPVFVNGSRNKKDNFRSISILPIVSKIF